MKRILAALLVLALAWVWAERQALADFPRILSAFTAKEYCSCRFVMGFEQDYCRSYVKQFLPISSLSEYSDRRQILVRALGVSSLAGWQAGHTGCRLLP